MLKEKIIKITFALLIIVFISGFEISVIDGLLKKHYSINLNWSLDIPVLMTVFILIHTLLGVYLFHPFDQKYNYYICIMICLMLMFIVCFFEKVKFVNNQLYFEWDIVIRAAIKTLFFFGFLYFLRTKKKAN